MCGSRTVTTALEGGTERAWAKGKGGGSAMLVGDESGGERNRNVRACVCLQEAQYLQIRGAACVQEFSLPKACLDYISRHLVFCPEGRKFWKERSQMDEMAHTHSSRKTTQEQQEQLLRYEDLMCPPPQLRSPPHSCTSHCLYCTAHLFWPFNVVQLLNAHPQCSRGASKPFGIASDANSEQVKCYQNKRRRFKYWSIVFL